MSTSQDDADALFGAPATPPPAASPSPVFPTAAPSADMRKEHRVKVSWPARVQLPGGRVVDLRVRDLSESGVGLLTNVNIPASTVLNFAIGVPHLEVPGRVVPVSGTLKTTYLVLTGPDLSCGGMFVSLPEDGRDLLNKWIRRLRK